MMTVWCCCLVIPILKAKKQGNWFSKLLSVLRCKHTFPPSKGKKRDLSAKTLNFFQHVQLNGCISVVKQVLKWHTSFYKIHCKENSIFCGFPALYASHHHGLLHPLFACDTELWAIQRQMQCHSCNSAHKLEKRRRRGSHTLSSHSQWDNMKGTPQYHLLKEKSGRRGQRFSMARMKIHEWELERREGEVEIVEKKNL